MSVDTVRRTFAKLEKAGYLFIGNYNKDPRDKTKWYTINDEKLEELYFELNKKKLKHERNILEKESQNTMHNALWQIAWTITRNYRKEFIRKYFIYFFREFLPPTHP
ncbi:hypothetical protein [Metamycoplasma equirhinis]|uniref:hypothetical protein n=1 Tax=Metamycoplasma equirhinis TaxID=92402 RepID=UPI004037271D